MRSVASFIQGLILLAVIGGCAYFIATHMTNVRQLYHKALWAVAPCSQPLTYSIGEFDTDFGISHARLLSDIDAAAEIWDKAAGKKVFAYSDSGELSINLIFDNRQKATITQNVLNGAIASDQTKYTALKSTYEQALSAYQNKKSALDAEVASYNSQKSSYEQEVNYWNAKGGAPKSEYGRIEQERTSLNAAATDINQTEDELKVLASQVNASVDQLNSLAKKMNLNVSEYNRVGASNGEEFDEGEYISDGQGDRIDIYQYDSEDRLVRVLAHELGHALGLEHVDDPNAIMYYLNESSNDAPTTADLAELKQVCKLN